MNLLFKIFGGSYDDLWKALIRPNRDIYKKEDLGPMKFEINDKCYKRTDFELINKKSQKIMCSFWEPFDEERESPLLPCVIYLHGNSSSRCEAYQDISYLLNRNITVFAFDFCGCGQSDGEYISLGYYEKKDVHCVVEYLLKSKKVSKIGLWGRSMGAVTAIMYANEHPSLIDAMVLDSGFYSLKILINELIFSKIKLPKFIFDKLLNMVKETVKEKAHFDLDTIEPYIFAKNCLVPAFFCHGNEDDFVLPHHSQDLFNEYKGKDKYIEFAKGGHNSSRPSKLIINICNFLKRHLKNDDEYINEYDKIIENDNDDEDFEEEEESIDKNSNIKLNKDKFELTDYKNKKEISINNINILKKEKSEENITSSSSSSNKKASLILYKKKHVKKDFLNTMKIKSNIMTLHFNDYKNKSKNNLKQNFIVKNLSSSTENINASNSLLNSVIFKTPYVKKNNRINHIEKTCTNFYIKNLNGANFIQNNFYLTNNSYFKRPITNYKSSIKKENVDYFSSNKISNKNLFKTKEKIIYKRKLKKRLLFNGVNSSQKKRPNCFSINKSA